MTDKNKIDALIEEAMSQVQVFASAWSMVGGPFDDGNCLENAEVEKQATRALFHDLFNAAILQAATRDERSLGDVTGAMYRCRRCGESSEIQFNYATFPKEEECCRQKPCIRPGKGPCDMPAQATRDAPSADAVDELVPWFKVMELAEKHGKGWSQYSGWAFLNDDNLHAFAQAIAAFAPKGDGND